MKLRPYQIEKMVNPTIKAMQEGHTDVLNVAPTGSGKTAVACWWAEQALKKDKKVLMLVHKNTILSQFMKTANGFGLQPNAIASGLPATSGNLQLAMVSTLKNRLDQHQWFDLIVGDECVTADTLVKTKEGTYRVDQLTTKPTCYILSYDGVRKIYSKLIGIKKSTRCYIVEIAYVGGILKCTPEHLIFTQEGWKKACEITMKDKLLYVDVDVAKKSESTKTTLTTDISKGIQNGIDQGSVKHNGKKDLKNILMESLCAIVVAVKKCSMPKLLKNLRKDTEGIVKANFCTGTTKDQKTGTINLAKKKKHFCLERFLAMLQLDSHITGQKTHELHGLMDNTKRHGFHINVKHCQKLGPSIEKQKMQGMEKYHIVVLRHVCLALQKYINSLIRIATKKKLQGIGLTSLMMKQLHGGFVTMVASIKLQKKASMFYFIQKDLRLKKIKLLQNTFLTISEVVLYQKQEEDTILSGYIQRLQKHYSQEYKNMYPKVCNTKFKAVTGIKTHRKETTVYDLTIDRTHCYFSNGLLSHNCHHFRQNNQWGQVIKHYKTINPNLKTIGMSATPNGRTDKLGLHPFFSEMVNDLSLRYLVEEGWLAYPHTVRGERKDPKFHITNGDYDKQEQKEHFTKRQIIGNAIDNYHQFLDGMPTIVSCVGLEHAYSVQQDYERAAREKGKNWKAVFIQGGKRYERQMFDALAGLANGSVQVVTFADVLGEGVDVPAVIGLQMLRKVRSYVLYKQFIGRILRPMWPDWFDPTDSTKEDRLIAIAKSAKVQAELQDFAGNTTEHKHPIFEPQWSLLDDKDISERDSITLPNQTVCLACGGVFPGKVIVCPDCGCNIEEELEKKNKDRTPEEIEGELVEVLDENRTEQEVKELTEEAMRIRALNPEERKKEMLASLRRNGNNDKSKALAGAVGYKSGWSNEMFRRKIVRM